MVIYFAIGKQKFPNDIVTQIVTEKMQPCYWYHIMLLPEKLQGERSKYLPLVVELCPLELNFIF